MDNDEVEKAYELYQIILNKFKDMDTGALASVLIVILGNLPKDIDEEHREEVIIRQAAAIIAEGITKYNASSAQIALKTADELYPFMAEAFEKYNESKSDKTNLIEGEGDLSIKDGNILLDLGRTFKRIYFTPEEAEHLGNSILEMAKLAKKERLNG